MLRDEGRLDIKGRLRHAAESPNKTMSEAAISYLPHLLKQRKKKEPSLASKK
jgi:hypothetical protein